MGMAQYTLGGIGGNDMDDLRDYFAGQVIGFMIRNNLEKFFRSGHYATSSEDQMVKYSYNIAEKMLQERNRRIKQRYDEMEQ